LRGAIAPACRASGGLVLGGASAGAAVLVVPGGGGGERMRVRGGKRRGDDKARCYAWRCAGVLAGGFVLSTFEGGAREACAWSLVAVVALWWT
jgi:cyanophycinase-like exopeptidase